MEGNGLAVDIAKVIVLFFVLWLIFDAIQVWRKRNDQ